MLRQFTLQSLKPIQRLAFLFLTASLYLLLLPAEAFPQSSATPDFSAQLINIESTTKQPFRFTATLHNSSDHSKIYQLEVRVPEGWNSVIQTQGSQITALKLDAGKSGTLSIQLTAPEFAKPGKFKIPVVAASEGTTLQLDLEAVVKGSYGLELTTPSGKLSDDITEGSNKVEELVVKNSGSLTLENIEISAQSPSQWGTTFDPSKIDRLEAGQSKTVKATVTVPSKTIAGDYVTTFTARNNNISADATFRMTVTTSVLSGWLGILVILIAIALIYYLIRKYGRR